MKLGKVIVAAALWIVVAGLGFWLYKIIQDPVQFEKDYQVRHDAAIERMEDIRTAQSYFLKSKGKYAGNFDELITSMKNDLITELVVKGNPDDTSIVTTYDTLKYYIKDKIVFNRTPNLDDLRKIPFSEGGEFEMQADVLTLQRVNVPVYEVIAPKVSYLKNLDKEYWSLKQDLVMGSVTQATDKGNWE
jgi:hypothetical protein